MATLLLYITLYYIILHIKWLCIYMDTSHKYYLQISNDINGIFSLKGLKSQLL